MGRASTSMVSRDELNGSPSSVPVSASSSRSKEPV
jgi:hypothetical protein